MTIIEQYEAAVKAERWSDALELATEIANQAPSVPTCWFNVGVCLDALGNHVDAARSFQKVLAIDIWDAKARFRMLRSLYLANAIQIVFDELEVMLEKHPGFVKEFFEIEMFQNLLAQDQFAYMLQTDIEQLAADDDSGNAS